MLQQPNRPASSSGAGTNPAGSMPSGKNVGVGTRRGLRDITNQGGSSKAGGVSKPGALKASASGPGFFSSADAGPSTAVGTSTVPSLMPLSGTSATSRAPVGHQYSRREADDIDARDSSNPLMVTEYVQDMYAHMRQKEITMRINPLYMARQPHINEKMRAILIDWLVEVHQKFRCVPDTLYLTINLIDRYLELDTVERSRLQLVGVTALLIAAKYEEIYPPELRDLVYITDKAYTREEILRMEESMLRALQYNVTVPSTHSFLVRYLKAAHADRRMVWMACYITERVLQEFTMMQYPPSVIASSAVYLARKNLQRNPWSPTLFKYTEYTEENLMNCLQDISNVLCSKSNLQAVKKKYSSSKFGCIATEAISGI